MNPMREMTTPEATRFLTVADAAFPLVIWGAPLVGVGNVIITFHPPAEIAALGWALLIAPAILALVCLPALLYTRYRLAQNSGPQGHPDVENIHQGPTADDAGDDGRLRMALRVTVPLAVVLALIVCSPLLPSLTAHMPA